MRAEPLGQDRRFNRYWRLLAGGEEGVDPLASRLLVELAGAPASVPNAGNALAPPSEHGGEGGAGAGPSMGQPVASNTGRVRDPAAAHGGGASPLGAGGGGGGAADAVAGESHGDESGLRQGVHPAQGSRWVEVASAEALEGLMGALERRGPREAALYNALLRHRDVVLQHMPATPLQCAQPHSLHRVQPQLVHCHFSDMLGK